MLFNFSLYSSLTFQSFACVHGLLSRRELVLRAHSDHEGLRLDLRWSTAIQSEELYCYGLTVLQPPEFEVRLIKQVAMLCSH